MLRLLPAFFFSATCAVPAQDSPAPAAAEKRALVFHRPETKGAKYEMHSTASMTRTTDYHMDDDVQPGGSDSVEVKLEGTLEVTAVTPKAGNITGYTFTVSKMALTDGSGADDGFEPGTIITAKVEKFETTFFAHGGEVQGNLKDGLELALPSLNGIDEEVDNDIAPPGPVAPGEKWEPDMKKFAASVKKLRGTELDVDNSKFTATYKGAAKVEGIEGDTITGSQKAVYSKVPELPEGAKLKSSTYAGDFTFVLPRDAKIAQALSSRSVMETKTRYADTHEGMEFEVDYKASVNSKATMKPVK